MPLEYVVGIDPGATGAIAILSIDGDLRNVMDLPTIGSEPVAMEVESILDALGRPTQMMVALEEPFAVASNSSARALAQGIGYGILLGVVGACGYRHERIKPGDWKRELRLPMSSKLSAAQKKRNSREHAARLWPDMAHHWAKATQDGRAEAALIGECLRRRMVGS